MTSILETGLPDFRKMILTVFESDIPHQISYGNYTGFDKKKKKTRKRNHKCNINTESFLKGFWSFHSHSYGITNLWMRPGLARATYNHTEPGRATQESPNASQNHPEPARANQCQSVNNKNLYFTLLFLLEYILFLTSYSYIFSRVLFWRPWNEAHIKLEKKQQTKNK